MIKESNSTIKCVLQHAGTYTRTHTLHSHTHTQTDTLNSKRIQTSINTKGVCQKNTCNIKKEAAPEKVKTITKIATTIVHTAYKCPRAIIERLPF